MHVMKNGAARPGVRLFTDLEEPGFFARWNPAAKVEYNTFVSYADFREGNEEDVHKDVTPFKEKLETAIRAANPECHLLDSTIKLDAATGLTAKLRNEGLESFRGTRSLNPSP